VFQGANLERLRWYRLDAIDVIEGRVTDDDALLGSRAVIAHGSSSSWALQQSFGRRAIIRITFLLHRGVAVIALEWHVGDRACAHAGAAGLGGGLPVSVFSCW
jgi:hypothetical protein